MIQVLPYTYKAVYDDPPTIIFKGYTFIALFSNIYSGEDINDNHSVFIEFIPTIKTNKSHKVSKP